MATKQLTRGLPYSLEAEQSVLGGILLDSAAMERVFDTLSADGADFLGPSHGKIYRAMAVLYEARTPIDVVTLTEKLDDEDLAFVGGLSYLGVLVEMVPTAANIKYYAKIVKEHSVRRWVISNATELIDSAYEGGEGVDVLVEKAQKRFAITNVGSRPYMTMQALIGDAMDEVDRLLTKPGAISGIATGFVAVDFYLGGLQSADLVVIAARPSMGKTAYAAQVATHISTHGKRVGFFSIEVSNRQMCRNILANQSRVETFKFRAGMTQDDMPKLSKTFSALAGVTFSIDDTSRTVLAISRQARKMKADHGLDIIFIDHLQLIREPGRHGSRNDEIGVITGALKALAKELNIPVVVLSQLSRDVEKRGGDLRPRLSDLRESGAIEQDADVVMFLHREEYYLKEKSTKPGIAEVIIAKHRNGPLGIAELKWSERFIRFDDLYKGR